jgi:photosystem II stability/assembly factor-like uncharacterized protein
MPSSSRIFAAIMCASLFAVSALGSPATAAKVKDPTCNEDRYSSKTKGWIGILGPEFPANDRFVLHDVTPLQPPVDGVTMREFAVSPHDPNLLFASNGFTVMRSKDAGCTWEQVYSITNPPSAGSPHSRIYLITDIVMADHPSAKDQIYLVLGENHWMYQAHGVYVVRSNDGGSTWDAAVQVATVGEYPHLEVAPSDPNILWLTVQTGLLGPFQFYKSTDGGGSWLPVTTLSGRSNDHNNVVFGVDPLDPNELWYWGLGQVRGTEWNANLLQHSTDGGKTWSEIVLGPMTDAIGFVDIFHAPGAPARLVANVLGKPISYRSDDGGVAWYPISPPGSAYLMAHGDVADEIVAINKNEGGSLAGMWRWDPRLARRNAYPWVQMSPPTIDSSCYVPYQSVHVTNSSPNVAYVAAHWDGCTGKYPIARYSGRL